MGKVLTISVAAYNIEAFIHRTLGSVLDDRILQDIEVLVIDDGGTDNSLQIAKEYSEKYPDTVFPIHKENGGYGSVLNLAFQRATGKYFKQLDGDDSYITDNLVEIVNHLKEIDVDYYNTPIKNLYESDGHYVLKDSYEDYDEGFYNIDEVMPKNVVAMHGAIIKTSILKNMSGSITEHCFYSDVELIALSIPYIDKMYISHKPLYEYRIGVSEQSVSLNGIRKHYKDHERVFWKLAKLNKRYAHLGEGRKEIMRLRAIKEAATCYFFIMVNPLRPQYFRETVLFDRKLKARCPELRDAAMEYRKKIKYLIKSKFLLYPVIRNRYIKQAQKGTQ